MLEIMIAMLLGLACHSNTTTNTNNTNGTYTTQDDTTPDTGGEGAHIPPK